MQFGPPMGLAGDAGALDIVTKTAAEVFGWPPQVVDQVGVDPGLVFGVDSVGGDLGVDGAGHRDHLVAAVELQQDVGHQLDLGTSTGPSPEVVVEGGRGGSSSCSTSTSRADIAGTSPCRSARDVGATRLTMASAEPVADALGSWMLGRVSQPSSGSGTVALASGPARPRRCAPGRPRRRVHPLPLRHMSRRASIRPGRRLSYNIATATTSAAHAVDVVDTMLAVGASQPVVLTQSLLIASDPAMRCRPSCAVRRGGDRPCGRSRGARCGRGLSSMPWGPEAQAAPVDMNASSSR